MTVRKAIWTILFTTVIIGAGIFYWRVSRLKNEVSQTANMIENLSKDIDKFNKELDELDRMMAEIDKEDAIIKNLKHLPKSTDGVMSSYHDENNGKKNYEDSWTQDIDQKEGIVLVTTIDSKMSIVIKPSAGDMQKFHVGWIAPVTFQCTKLKKGKCDFNAPYKLFVSNGLVEVKQLIFPKK